MKYELCKQVMRNDRKRKGFDALAQKTFGLSFEQWYQSGDWGDWNQPYTLYDGDKAISNITVNRMKAFYQGKMRNYIQLGGVMTEPEYRGQGLSRILMEEVQKDWADKCDAMFLLANRSVTEFYPRFGFVEEKQYQCVMKGDAIGEFKPDSARVRKLDLSEKEDMDILIHCYEKHNPFSQFQMVENSSLLHFYCYEVFHDAVYYIPEEDAVMVAEWEKDNMECYDIYYDGKKSLLEILHIFCGEELPKITFLFTPNEKEKITEQEYIDEDTHLFVLKEKENIFHNAKLYVPDISHT